MSIEDRSPGRWEPSGATRAGGESAENGSASSPRQERDDSVRQTRMASLLDDTTEVTGIAAQSPTPDAAGLEPESEGGYAPGSLLTEPDDHAENANLRIRGRTDGVAVEIGAGDWRELLTQLDERLQQSAGFFRGGNVALLVGGRHLDEVAIFEARELLDRYGLVLGVVRTSSERTFDATLAIGLAATLEGEESEQQVVAHPADSNDEFRAHFVYRGNLRSGQVLHRRESILVIGDVNPGANVISEGDVLIWGRLRGVAHAGSSGDEESIIGALFFAPIQLRIGGLIAIAPDKEAEKSRTASQSDGSAARIAYVTDERIVVADWSEARRSGRLVLRR